MTPALVARRRAALAGRERDAKRPTPPLAAAEAYAARLRGLNRDLAREVRRFLAPWLREVAGRREDADPVRFGDLLVRLERIVARRLSIVDEFGERLARVNLADMRDVLRIDLDSEPPRVVRALERWRRENVDLITSIPKRLHADVRDVVRRAAREGTRVEAISAELAERFGVSRSRANLIARDQILKGNADLTRSRCQDAGVTRYRWSTSRDERVRGTPGGKWPKGLHYALDGRIFSFDDPPIVNLGGERGNPGEDYQCRCVAIPILGAPP